MRGFYSIRPRAWPGRRIKPNHSAPDAYAPGSVDYAERHRQTSTLMPSGLTRIDLGEPVKRVAGHPQPVTIGAPSAPLPAPKPDPVSLPPCPAPSCETVERDWRHDYGLAKRP